ncbi:molecular chaperone HscC, partial [Pseudoalteromonas issachenkonii]
MSENEVLERFRRLNALKVFPKDKLVNSAFKAKLERLFQENVGDKRREIGEAIGEFMEVLETHDNHKI